MRVVVRCALAVLFLGALPGVVQAQSTNAKAKKVIQHWTPERRGKAMPRDLFIDKAGNGYSKKADGTLTPYGKGTPSPMGKPSGGDSTPPTISNMAPADGTTIGTSHTFSANVTDASGIKSVSFVIHYPSGATQSFVPSASGDVRSLTIQGFSQGAGWGWHVVATDNGAKGGNTATSATLGFTVGGGRRPTTMRPPMARRLPITRMRWGTPTAKTPTSCTAPRI